MYLAGFSLDNLSLMALTIATGFVVDDAIVMIENIARYIEEGDTPLEAALKGSGQIGFTIISLTISLIAVLIPLLFMGDVVGRLFREFAITLAVTILISAVVSLDAGADAMREMDQASSRRRKAPFTARRRNGSITSWSPWYGVRLDWVLDHQPLTLLVAADAGAHGFSLHRTFPKGFFPVQDTGSLPGHFRSAAIDLLRRHGRAPAGARRRDSEGQDVESLSSFIGVDGTNTTLNAGRLSDQSEAGGSSAA
jgi:multidrug efflux pump